MMSYKNYLVAALILAVSGCTKAPKADTPEGALQSYVVAAFSAKSIDDRKILAELSTGDALEFLQGMSDADFKRHFLDSNFQLVSMKARDLRQDVTGDVSLVYDLSYREGSGSSRTVHTNKKIAYLTQNPGDGTWKIRATKNIKSFIERKDDLVVTPETTGE
jgi:hypothetical protein